MGALALYPLADLLTHLALPPAGRDGEPGLTGATELGRRCRVSKDEARRWIRRGALTERMADRVCTDVLDVHMALVWPDYFSAVA